MTDKERLEAVIDEIKRQIGEYYDRDTPVSLDKADALQCILDYADSIKKKEETVSEDFEKEADSFFENMTMQEYENIFEDTFKNIARHFADWQKQQIFKVRDKEKLFSEKYEENFEDEFAKTLAERKCILPKDEDRFSDMDLYHVALHFNGWKKWKMTKDVITGDVDFYEHGPIICTHLADVQKLVDKHHLKQDDEVRLVMLTED